MNVLKTLQPRFGGHDRGKRKWQYTGCLIMKPKVLLLAQDVELVALRDEFIAHGRAAVGTGVVILVAVRQDKQQAFPDRHRTPADGAVQLGCVEIPVGLPLSHHSLNPCIF